jgi:hypothetical protein
VRAVHGTVVQVQQLSPAQLGQQSRVQTRPHAGLRPVPQSTPSSHPGAAHGLRRNIAPGDTGPQHVHHPPRGQPGREHGADPGNGDAAREQAAATVTRAPRGRQNKIRTRADTLASKRKVCRPTHSERSVRRRRRGYLLCTGGQLRCVSKGHGQDVSGTTPAANVGGLKLGPARGTSALACKSRFWKSDRLVSLRLQLQNPVLKHPADSAAPPVLNARRPTLPRSRGGAGLRHVLRSVSPD